MRVTLYNVVGFATINNQVKFVGSNRPLEAYEWTLEHSGRSGIRLWKLPEPMNKDAAKIWVGANADTLSDAEREALKIPVTNVKKPKEAAPVVTPAPEIVKTPEEIEAERVAAEEEEKRRAEAMAAAIEEKKKNLAAIKKAATKRTKNEGKVEKVAAETKSENEVDTSAAA